MCSLKEASSGAVSRDGLVVLAFCRECVRKADPGGAEMRVHHRGFGEEAPGFGDLVDTEVVNAYCEPSGRFIRVKVRETVRKEEKGICLVKLMEASEVKGVDCEIILVCIKDGGCNGKGLFEAALCEQKFRFRE